MTRRPAAPPTRKVPPRPASRPLPAARPLRPGQKVALTFRAMDPDGSAVGSAGAYAVAVPFAIPGEEALVEIVRGGRPAEGRIVSLIRKSPLAAAPRCRHFGICGGCQWQHLTYEAQLEYKTTLVREQLAFALEPAGVQVAPAIGTTPWEYRSRLQATFAVRQDRLVAGYHAAAEDLRIINVRECPIQHGVNVRALGAVRDVIAGLDWPVYDHASRRGLVRGMIVQTAAATGEIMVVLSTAAELPDRMAYVRAMREALTGLISLVLSIQPRHSPELLGRLNLLWGRAYIEEEIDGLRVRLFPRASTPPTPRATVGWLEAIAGALAAGPNDVIMDAACEDGLVPVWLARRTARVVGIAPDREAMHHAWEHARLNGVENCVFYTRAPARVVAKLRERGGRFDAAVLTSRRAPAPPELFAGLADAGAQRLALAGSSLPLLAADLRTAQGAGFHPRAVQPVDLLPQTSRIHSVVSLVRAQGR